MPWRHLAYGNILEDQIDSDAEPMVLIASGSNNSNLPDDSTIDASLAINVRSSKESTASSDISLLADAIQGTNVTIPVSVQKSTGGLTPSRIRDWSEEEDMKLAASVQKYGEPDWSEERECYLWGNQ